MWLANKLWKRAYKTLFLLLFSSCTQRISPWQHDEIATRSPEYDFVRLKYQDPELISGPKIELIKSKDHLRMYLNVSSLGISTENPDKSVPVKIEIEGNFPTATAYKLEGKQRLLFPEETRDVIIDALLHNEQVLLTVERYKIVLKPEGFTPLFKKYLRSKNSKCVI